MNENQEHIAVTVWSPILDTVGGLIERSWDRSRESVGTTDDPRMVSVQLFRRLRDHRNAFVTLVNARLYLDSEVILRSAIETAICLVNLNQRGGDFIADLRSDAARTLKGQIPIWFKNDPGLKQGAVEDLDSIFGGRRPDGSKHEPFRWENLANQAAASDLYGWYKHLSGMSVHVTGISVFRHADFVEGPTVDDRFGVLRRRARVQALGMMCGAGLFGCRAHIDTLGYTDLASEVAAIMDRLADASALV